MNRADARHAVNNRFEIRHIPLWPAVKLAFIVFLVVGILFAILYALMLAAMGFLASTFGESVFGEDMGILKNLGFVMIPVIAILYAVFGTIAAVVWILVYNVVASVVGGVEVELKKKERWMPGEPIQVAESPNNSTSSDIS
jgi:hypothetical protein